MATVYFGVNVGGHTASDVAIDTSSTGANVQLSVNDAVVVAGSVEAKQQLLKAIEAIRLAVMGYDY